MGGKGQQGLDLKGAGTAQTQVSPKLMQLPPNMRLTHSTALPFLPFTSIPEIPSLPISSSLSGESLHLPFSSVETVLSVIQTGDEEGSVALVKLYREKLPVTLIIRNHSETSELKLAQEKDKNVKGILLSR